MSEFDLGSTEVLSDTEKKISDVMDSTDLMESSSDQGVDTLDTPPGNTKTGGGPRSRSWEFTWKHKDDTLDTLISRLDLECEKYLFSLEKGKSGYLHYQGTILFKNARYREAVKKLFDKTVHLEPTRAKKGENLTYCAKPETHVAGPWTKGYKVPKEVKDPLEGKVPYTWQKKVLEVIRDEPDDRKIYWFWEPEGNTGKSALCKHLCLKEEALCLDGKVGDIKYGIARWIEEKGEGPRILVLDFARTREGTISYQGLEDIKNGCFYSTKYESGMVMYNTPHVFCFANFPPEEHKMSKDRWVVERVGKGG